MFQVDLDHPVREAQGFCGREPAVRIRPQFYIGAEPLAEPDDALGVRLRVDARFHLEGPDSLIDKRFGLPDGFIWREEADGGVERDGGSLMPAEDLGEGRLVDLGRQVDRGDFERRARGAHAFEVRHLIERGEQLIRFLFPYPGSGFPE